MMEMIEYMGCDNKVKCPKEQHYMLMDWFHCSHYKHYIRWMNCTHYMHYMPKVKWQGYYRPREKSKHCCMPKGKSQHCCMPKDLIDKLELNEELESCMRSSMKLLMELKRFQMNMLREQLGVYSLVKNWIL